MLIADDTDLMPLTIAELLKREPCIKEVAEAATFAETLALTAAVHPTYYCWICTPDEREHARPEKITFCKILGVF